MIRCDARWAVGGMLAIAVPALVLHFTAGPERHAAGLTAAPFAWPRLLAAHLAFALPLGFIVASRLRSVAAVREIADVWWAVLGFAAIGLVALLGEGVGEAIVGGEFGTLSLLIRATIAFTLVLPWCVPATVPATTESPAFPIGTLALGLGLALLPCALYADAIAESRTASATELVTTGRLVRAERLIAGLCELGSNHPITGKSPCELHRKLRSEIERLGRVAAKPLPTTTPPGAKLARAEVLMQLDRLDEAAELLHPLTQRSVTATLLLAAIDRDRGHWEASEAGYTTALTQLLPTVETNPTARDVCRMSFEGLAYIARQNGRPADAEAALHRGLQAIPSEAAHFHYLLGRHYHDGGRPVPAVDHLEEAIRLQPLKFREPADKLLREIRVHTPACILSRSK
jgi:hypothetical protein